MGQPWHLMKQIADLGVATYKIVALIDILDAHSKDSSFSAISFD